MLPPAPRLPRRPRRLRRRATCFGEGLEIGAAAPAAGGPAARPRPLRRPDERPTDLRREYPELADWDLTEVDIVDDGEKLATIAAESQDFIVANHFLEHTEDPIGTIETHLSKLKPGGVLFYAVPDKRYTFDFRRPVTPIEHMVADHERGPGALARRTLRRVVPRCVIDEESPSSAPPSRRPRRSGSRQRAQQLEAQAYSIHMHVWTQAEFLRLILDCRERFDDAFDIEAAARVGIEFIVVLRKRGRCRRPAGDRRGAGRARADREPRREALARLRQAGARRRPASGDRDAEGRSHSRARAGARRAPRDRSAGPARRASASRPTGSTR